MKARPRRSIASRKIANKEGIDCDFRRLDGYLFQGDGMPSDPIDQDLDAVRAVGAPVELYRRSPQRMRWPPRAALSPAKRPFTRSSTGGLAEACAKRQVQFFADTPVEEVSEENAAVTVRPRAALSAGHAVVATNSSIVDRGALHSKTAPYRTYVMALPSSARAAGCALLGHREPYHYVPFSWATTARISCWSALRITKGGEADDADERFQRLEQWSGAGQRCRCCRMSPIAGRARCSTRSTMRASSAKTRDRVRLCRDRDSGQGLTHGVMGASSMRPPSPGGESKWTALLCPDRKPQGRQELGDGKQHRAGKNLAGYVTPGEIGSTDELKPGQGAICAKA